MTKKDVELDTLPLSKLKITGNFQQSDMNAWVHSMFPNMDEIGDKKQVELHFICSFVGTLCHMNYKEGVSDILSDSVSTLNIIKDHISQEANYRNIQIDFEWKIEKKSIERVLKLLD